MLLTRSPSQWSGILVECGVEFAIAARWAPAFSRLLVGSALNMGEVELDDFLGQVLHECQHLERLEENLNYSAQALIVKFGRHRISIADAQKYGRIDGKQPANKQAIANCIYGGDWGRANLGNTQPNDGWYFRGRGPIQATGRANYSGIGTAIGVDLMRHPDALMEPDVGLLATIRWWERTLPDSVINNLPNVTKRVNGGYNGLEERGRLTTIARRALDR